MFGFGRRDNEAREITADDLLHASWKRQGIQPSCCGQDMQQDGDGNYECMKCDGRWHAFEG